MINLLIDNDGEYIFEYFQIYFKQDVMCFWVYYF